MSLKVGFQIQMSSINLIKKLLDCIYCSSKRITKSIMAPMVSVVKKNTNNSTKLNKNLASEKENL